jgi:23S rRNA (adenine2503-C2)-methyltransferase
MKLRSLIDKSINYVKPYGKSNIEYRYVRRKPEYISLYVSSHNGCKMGCKMCWLTQTKQTNFNHVTIDEYNKQVFDVLSNDNEGNKSDIRVNINFMSREPLANKYVINNYSELYDRLYNTVNAMHYKEMNMNISSIFPNTIKYRKLVNIFGEKPVNIYYSIYTHNDKKKRTIMPNTIDTVDALNKIHDYVNDKQYNKMNQIIFHCAFIESFNDDINEIKEMANLIKSYNFPNTKFNLVRYNAYENADIDKTLWKSKEVEQNKLDDIFEIMNDAMTNKVRHNKSRIIQRVGQDVYASCGMFYDTGVKENIL